jgi:hypothetical protein
MKNVFLALVKFILFLIVFAAGSFFPPFHIERVVGVTPDGTRVFIWDGLLLMTALFVVILLIEALRKRLAASGPWTAAAFVLAGIAGYVAKFGFLTR